ncbi:MAG: rhomboid family intramembrane serine protease [Erysipelotrichaceae bacterium]|nr:rhomboid family intramembrane serine protease [Erysipelotrichaceae bacterium]
MRQEDVWALQLVYFFINRYDYRLVSVSTGGHKNELWLTNPQGKYPVIRVSTLSVSANYFDMDRIMKTKQAILDLVRTTGLLLSLHISNESTDNNGKDMLEVCIGNDYISSDILNADYPEITTLIKPIDNPQREYEAMTKAINLLQIKGVQKNKSWAKTDISATYVIMAVCILVFLAALGLTSITGDDSVSAILVGSLYKTFVYGNFEYWRLFTSGFVHIDPIHLLSNMYALYLIGPSVERLYGKKQFLLALFGSIIIGSAFALVGDVNTITVGISGGLFGLLGMLLVFSIESKSIRDRRVMSSFIQIFLINTAVALLVPNISWLGHLGGFTAGLMFGLIFSKKPEWKVVRYNSIFAIVIMSLALTYLSFTDNRKKPIYSGTDYMVVQAVDKLGLSWYGDMLENNLVNYYQTVVK